MFDANNFYDLETAVNRNFVVQLKEGERPVNFELVSEDYSKAKYLKDKNAQGVEKQT